MRIKGHVAGATHDTAIEAGGATRMTDYIQAWQCIGCGKIEAPQPCIGVCKDRKVFMVGKDEHEQVLAENAALHARLEQARAMLLRFGVARPREGQWERSWLALQGELREALAVLDAAPPGAAGR
jgi:hypothetical protein